ncbi:MAG TPA: ABC transporter permease [Micromonosporaceae bacterium]|nr:ABC transporter permease [Micromonosporaceae bacterium]
MAGTTVADPGSGLTPAELAARHGLTVAGQRPGLLAYTKQLWAYRNFITAYANARVVASFSQSRLGRLWQVLTPLVNAAVYYLIFGVVLNTRGGVPNFIAYLCTGLFVFIYTQTVVSNGVQAVTSNLGLIRALHFPRASLPISLTLVQAQNLLASMLVLIGIVLVTGEPITLEWLFIVPALFLQSVFNLGLGLAFARLGAKLPDLKQVMPFVMRTWMYGSAVLYSADLFAEHLPGWAARLMQVNPMLVYIELMRDALLADAPLASGPVALWALGVGWALLVGIGGFVYFWIGEQEYGRG